MHKISKERKTLILAIIISLLIHLILLFLLFTYKSDHQFALPFSKKEELKIIKIIEEPPPAPQQVPQPQQPQISPSMMQSLTPPQPQAQPQQEPLFNPQSQKEAEILEGQSITDDTTTEEGAATTIDSATPDDSTQAPEFSTDEPAPGLLYEETIEWPEPLDQIQESEEVELESEPVDQLPTTEQEEPPQPEEPLVQAPSPAQDKVLTIQEPDAPAPLAPLRPSQQRKEKARKALSNFARAFSEQYEKVQDARRSDQTASARIRRQQTELQTMSYRQKIDQSIHESAFRNGSVYSDIDINQYIEGEITLDRSGKVINFVLKKRTLSPVINNYLKRIVYNAQFPPLPRNLNLDSFTYTWSPYIKIIKGMNNLSYYYQ